MGSVEVLARLLILYPGSLDLTTDEHAMPLKNSLAWRFRENARAKRSFESGGVARAKRGVFDSIRPHSGAFEGAAFDKLTGLVPGVDLCRYQVYVFRKV